MNDNTRDFSRAKSDEMNFETLRQKVLAPTSGVNAFAVCQITNSVHISTNSEVLSDLKAKIITEKEAFTLKKRQLEYS